MLSVIVNPSSGGGRCGSLLPGVEAELTRRLLPYRITRTRSIEHARELAREAAGAGETAVAFGGDGLVGAVAGALAGSAATFAVLPGGRGNDFARMIGLTGDPVAACETIESGDAVSIDLGRADDETFLGIASCGFDSVANKIANETKLVRGNLVYAYGGIRALLGWKPVEFRLTLDGEHRELHGYSVVVANSAMYGGGMRIAPDASLTDGKFDVVLFADTPRVQFLRHLPKAFDGSHVKLPSVEVLRAASVRIETDRPFDVYADGDPVSTLPSELRVLPAAVKVLAPADGPLGDPR